MKSRTSENPFTSTGYIDKEHFCDREDETNILINNLQNGNSTTIISIRRIGKTGLIQHVLSQLPAGWKGIYVDILETENLNQFLNIIATGILNAMPEKSSTGKKFWNFVKSLRPLIKFDPLTGAPQASFDIKQTEVEMNINSVLQFLEKQENKILIAIDEFQQILNYPEKNTDAWLRTRIQLLKNINFIFSGSQQHLMTELFTSPKRPFFRSTSMLKLNKINKTVYRNFIVELFIRYKKEISPELAEEIIDWTAAHTYYVQQLCNRVFSVTKKNSNT